MKSDSIHVQTSYRRGRPRKTVLPDSLPLNGGEPALGASGTPVVEKPRRRPGRPRKHPLPETPLPGQEGVVNEKPKRRPGRPRKNPLPADAAPSSAPEVPKRRPGRPRKHPLPTEKKQVSSSVSVLPESSNTSPATSVTTDVREQQQVDAHEQQQIDVHVPQQAVGVPLEEEQSRKQTTVANNGQNGREGALYSSSSLDSRENGNGSSGYNNGGKGRRGRYSKQSQPFKVEPTLSRKELASWKVAQLRAKAAELEIDSTGMRKPVLVEAIYAANARAEGFCSVEGILDITREGFGFVRTGNYMQGDNDAFVPQQMIKALGLRRGDKLSGTVRPSRPGDKFPALARITTVNDDDVELAKHRVRFRDLTPVYPDVPLTMEHGKDSITGRAIDLVAPIGKGQRGLIVSPPKAGKTTVLKKICESIAANNPDVCLICLLVDERPEEVTDMQRSIKGDVVASTFDMPADNHTAVSELVIERAKRLVEIGKDVVVVLDSITRLARAYNIAAPVSGRILSGGVDSAALYPPKRFLGAARNIEGGGSLTIIASALIETGSKMDEVIFEEFKGTGNMELKLDRDLADKRIFPAIDPVSSGTRNEDLLIDASLAPFVWGIRRILANMNNTERAASALVKGLSQTRTNEDFLVRSAKKAQQSECVDIL